VRDARGRARFPAPSRLRAHPGSGFTLLELVAVCVLVGLLLAFSPRAFGFLMAEKELESEVSRLATTIDFIKSQAVLDQFYGDVHLRGVEESRRGDDIPNGLHIGGRGLVAKHNGLVSFGLGFFLHRATVGTPLPKTFLLRGTSDGFDSGRGRGGAAVEVLENGITTVGAVDVITEATVRCQCDYHVQRVRGSEQGADDG